VVETLFCEVDRPDRQLIWFTHN